MKLQKGVNVTKKLTPTQTVMADHLWEIKRKIKILQIKDATITASLKSKLKRGNFESMYLNVFISEESKECVNVKKLKAAGLFNKFKQVSKFKRLKVERKKGPK